MIITPSKITDIKLYYRGATITRSGTVSLKEGNNTIYISGISTSMSRESLRFRFPEGTSIGNMNIVDKKLFQGDEEEKKLEEDKKLIEAENENLKYEQEMWKASIYPIKEGNVASAEEIAEIVNSSAEQVKRIAKKIEENEKKISDIDEKLEEIEKDMSIAELEIICDKEADYQFEMIYQENSAAWKPAYELLVDTDAGKINLRLKGIICQETDEDWEDVNICMISGSQPKYMSKPVLNPYYLNARPQPVYAGSARAKTSVMMEAAAMAPMADMAMGNTMMLSKSMLDESATSKLDSFSVQDSATGRTEFKLGHATNVRKDTDEKGVYIWSRIYSASIEYLAVPLENNDVYVLAKFDDKITDLIDGECLLYVNGVYSGKINISPDKLDDEIVLGVENRIFVRRKRIRKFKSTVPIKGTNKIEYEFELGVENKKQSSAKLTIIDRIPVSAEKDIGVKIDQVSGAELNEDNNMLKWKLELEAGEEKKLPLRYTVTYPGSMSVYLPD